VAVQACHTVIFVSPLFIVLIVCSGLAVFMTVNAGEDRIIGRIRVAFGAAAPFVAVPAGIDREIEAIVYGEFGWFPAGLGSMALDTCCGEVHCQVVRIGGGVIIVLVAGETIW
jgi:hypothetical protein